MIEIVGFGMLLIIATSDKLLKKFGYFYLLHEAKNRVLFYLILLPFICISVYVMEGFKWSIMPILFFSFLIIMNMEVSIMFKKDK